MHIIQILLALSSFFVTAHAATSWIVPGAEWKARSGDKIDAHGGMVYQEGDTFYWIGQAVSDGVTPYIYQSKDMLDWDLIKPDNAIRYLWRPKFAKPNGQYWMYGQNNNRLVQGLKSASLTSGYQVTGKATSLPPNGYTYSDTGMFNEPGTNKWYLLTSADHNTIQVNRINDDGTIGAQVNRLNKGALEAPGILKVGNTYYLVVSGKTGYRNNPNKIFWTDKLEGGTWNGPTDIAPPSTNTYNSQNTFELTIRGSQKTTYIYMGDSWVKDGGAGSNYIWLPIQVDSNSKTLTLDYHAQWKIDIKTGVVSFPQKKRRYEAEHAFIKGQAMIADCEHCVSKRGVQKFSSDSTATFLDVRGLGGEQWVQFHYRIANRSLGEAYVSVNDEFVYNISSLNTQAGYHDIIPVKLNLRSGDGNKISFGVYGRNAENAGVILDGIEVIED